MMQIAEQLIVGTTTVQVMLASMGVESANSAARFAYQPRWNAVLAAAYANIWRRKNCTRFAVKASFRRTT